ncbi:hypothetical protein [Lysobacter humi (ex Lee et al. 2017)]
MSYGRLMFCMVLLSGCSAPRFPPTERSPDAVANAPASTAAMQAGQTHDTHARSAVDPFTALAELPAANLDQSTPQVSQFLDRYFPDACSPDERLAFDAVCQYYGTNQEADPSPWPELVIGVDGGRLASVVLIDHPLPLAGWMCRDLPLPAPLRTCFAAHTSHEDRVLWTQQWTAYFSAAD